jgi:hypothetical protein
MKYFYLLLLLLCPASVIQAQYVNQIIKDPGTGVEYLYGKVTLEGFHKEPFKEWFEEGYSNYQPESDILEILDTDILSTWFVTIVMGTWCPDSRRELPRFFRIWDELGLDPGTITVIGVDASKSAPSGMIDSLSIEKVPTFIFYQCNMELGRVVESPEESLEKELFRVLYEF